MDELRRSVMAHWRHDPGCPINVHHSTRTTEHECSCGLASTLFQLGLSEAALAAALTRATELRKACGPIVTLLDIMDERARMYGVALADDELAVYQRIGGGMTLMLTWGQLRALRAVLRAVTEGEHGAL